MEEPSYYNEENADRFQRYEAEFKQYLMALEEITIVGGESIRSSKWPGTRVYADPDVTYVEPVQLLVQEEAEEEAEQEEEGEGEGEGEEEEKEEQGEEEGEEEVESVDSAPAEISPGAEKNSS